MIGIILFLTFILLLFLNVPIAISLGFAGVVGVLIMEVLLSLVAYMMYASLAKVTLLSIPFFITAGVVMEKAGISKRLVHFANTLVGQFTLLLE